SNVDLRVVRCWPQRAGHKGRTKEYQIIPELLEKRQQINLEQSVATQFWLTIKVPRNIQPGTYTSRVLIKSGERVIATVPLELEVYPFTLVRPNDVTIGIYEMPRKMMKEGF